MKPFFLCVSLLGLLLAAMPSIGIRGGDRAALAGAAQPGEPPWFRDATRDYGPIGAGPPAFADLDGDGFPELICDGKIYRRDVFMALREQFLRATTLVIDDRINQTCQLVIIEHRAHHCCCPSSITAVCVRINAAKSLWRSPPPASASNLSPFEKGDLQRRNTGRPRLGLVTGPSVYGFCSFADVIFAWLLAAFAVILLVDILAQE